MKVKDLFEKDPRRRLEPVVKVDVHEEEVISNEVDEYVVTDQIRDVLNDIVDRFIESRTGRAQPVCAWISGFFGSGKSHFLKMLGYTLTNKKVKLSTGREVGVAKYFGKKHDLRGTHIIAKELKTRALFVNMLSFDREKERSLSRILFRVLLRELGLSEIFWVAEIELMLKRKGLWGKFVKFVEKEEDMPWDDVRRSEVRVRSALIRGLTNVDPTAYPTISIAGKAVEDAEREFTMDPERLARRLVEEAETIDKERGRLVLMLDEIGLYIFGHETDRLTELNALAENVEKFGRGKVWIFATAQEALEQILPEVERRRPELEWIRDRFQIKVSLLPENIPTVVNKRLLKKERASKVFSELEALYKKYEGALKMNALMQDPARDPHGVFTQLNFDAFSESYPLVPYHVPLMIDIFGVLRSRGPAGRPIPELTGRERAILAVVRYALLDLIEKGEDVGALVTFDRVYDAISEELKAVRSEYQASISEITKAGEIEGMKLEPVAKALFLLQHVGKVIPSTIHNVAAILYPSLGVDQKEHEERVRACLEELVKKNWTTEEEGKYRFLSEVERTFEQDIARQTVRARNKEVLAFEIAKEGLKALRKYNYEGRTFNVHLWIDDQEVTTTGHLKLKFYTPYWTINREDALADLSTKSLAEDDTIFWVCEESNTFENKLIRALAIGMALDARERKVHFTPELDRYRKEMDFEKRDELPSMLLSSAGRGTTIFRGEETRLQGKESVEEVFNRFMKRLADELFTEFYHARVRIERDEVIGSILMWKGGSLPSVYLDLKLVDRDGNISLSAPIVDRIYAEIKQRMEKGEECTGISLGDHFDAPPYGWDSRAVRLALATLFKSGALQVEGDGRTYISPEERASHELFTSARAFKKARFLLGRAITTKQKGEARRLLSEVFGRRVGPTPEDITKELDDSAGEFLGSIGHLKTIEGFPKLPYVEELTGLEKALMKMKQEPSYSDKILTFLDDATLRPIRDGVSVLKKLDWFVKSGKMDIYLSARRFMDRPLDELIQIKGELSKEKEKLESKIDSKTLLDEWEKIYKIFDSLSNEYTTIYKELHMAQQRKVKNAVENLTKRAKSKRFDANTIKGLIAPLQAMLCGAGEKGKYDDTIFCCTSCHKSLPTLRYNVKVAIDAEFERARRSLVETAAKTEKVPTIPPKWFKEGIVDSVEKFERIVEDASEAVQYAVAKKKKAKVRVEVERS